MMCLLLSTKSGDSGICCIKAIGKVQAPISQGGEKMQLAFFAFFSIFGFGQKLQFIAFFFFLHLDATSAKDQ